MLSTYSSICLHTTIYFILKYIYRHHNRTGQRVNPIIVMLGLNINVVVLVNISTICYSIFYATTQISRFFFALHVYMF